MKKISFKKGFTLIELLVVVAIIGILASVVLASLNTARSKGADAAIKANLDNMRAQAALDYSTNNTYNTVATTAIICTATSANPSVFSGCTGPLFGDTVVQSAMSQAAQQGSYTVTGATDGTNGQTYAIEGVLKSSNVTAWCVDSTGASKQETITAGVTGAGISGQTVCQ